MPASIDALLNFLISPLGTLLIISVASIKLIPRSWAPNVLAKIALAFIAWLWFVSFRYYSPESVQNMYSEYSFNLQPSFDEPAIFFFLILAWLAYTALVWMFVELQKNSDIIVAPGMSYPTSCSSANLRYYGEIGCIRVGGIKQIPTLEGDMAMFFPLTHVFLIGTHLIVSALCTQNTTIMHAPFQAKDHIRAQRGGILGINRCTGGYLTNHELTSHRAIPAEILSNFDMGDKHDKKQPLSTQAFLNRLTNMNIMYDYQLQVREDENEGVRKKFKTFITISKSVQTEEKSGLFDAVVGTGK